MKQLFHHQLGKEQGVAAAVPLLRTKLFIPRSRTDWVARPRLVRRLTGAANHPLTLIVAPAGFGKTTLLADWIAQHEAPVAWISLDNGDNDPARFWLYFVVALQTVQADLGASALTLIESPQPPPIQSILTLLLNDLDAQVDPITLILDDYHLIETQAIHTGLAFLLDHLPPQLRLVIASRADPFLPVSRLRAQRQLLELRATDLRFTSDEAASFLNQAMTLNLTAADIAILEQQTEGWIAGLQLAALSMQGRDNLPDFIAAFTGSHRYILDYLTDEVLERRPAGTDDFLLQTAILDRLCGSLCDAVTGGSDGQAILERLEQANLFIVPLDDERRWYRYHHLFAEVLQARLRQSQPDRIPELHRRASVWFEAHGLTNEAIRHAMLASDVEQAATLVEQAYLIRLQRSEMFVIRAWLAQLPPELVQTRPRLILARAWVLTFTGHTQEAKQWLAEPQITTVLNTPELPAAIRGELALLRATIVRYRYEGDQELELFAQQALDYLPEAQQGLRAAAVHMVGVAQFRQGDTAAARQAFVEAAALGDTEAGPYMALTALQDLISIQIRQGQLTQIKQTCQQAMSLATRWGGQILPAAGMAYIDFGGVLYEQNELAEATQALTHGIDLLRGSTEQYLLAEGYTILARIQQVGGDPQAALATITRGEAWFKQMQIVDFEAGTFLALGQTRLWLEQDNLPAAIRWAENCNFKPEDTHRGYHQAVTFVRVRLAQNQREAQAHYLQEAATIINRMLAAAEVKAWWGHVIELSILRALLCQVQGDSDAALAVLARALPLAEPEGYVRLFLDEGQPMIELLKQARAANISPAYIDQLLASFNPTEQDNQNLEPQDSTSRPSPTPLLIEPLIEPLTERELELLQLVTDGLSNQEIAQELFLAVGTVKKHLNNIFGKLDVSSRTQAAARARELDLL